MKRSLKAALAGGAAVVLLASGAGTFARWYDSAEAGRATISTGTLSHSVEEGAWLINTLDNPQATKPFDPSRHTIVPGDVLTYTVNATPTLVGENLQATFAAKLDNSGLESLVTQQGEPGKIQLNVTATNDQGNLTTLTPADSGKPVTVTLTFPEYKNSTEASTSGSSTPDGSWWYTELQNQEISLENIEISLAQNDR